MGPPGRGHEHLGFSGFRVLGDGAARAERRGGVHVAAVVSAVTVAVRRRGHRALGDRNRRRSGSVRRRFEFVRQDEFPEFGASGVALGGDVHVGGVSAQQPRCQEREGDASSAAMDLRETEQTFNLHV